MANLYTVELNYRAVITVDVSAEDEGEALTKARELAEMAPMNSFSLADESHSRIVQVNNL